MLVIVVFGASGDLARRKTYPALFALYCHGFLPADFCIFGYARTVLSREAFCAQLLPLLRAGPAGPQDEALLARFLAHCEYVSGAYDQPEGYAALVEKMQTVAGRGGAAELFDGVRLYYLALPPSVFVGVSEQVKKHLYSADCANRVIVEKPFGRDLESSCRLSAALAALFREEEIYRIDHYLGKEMVRNVLMLRFGNILFNAVWSREHIANVQIVFKETMGVERRGGYFDEFGIIRDVMQNHLLQMLAIVAMERPATLDAEDVRDEKVKVLRCIAPLAAADLVLGQYVRSEDGSRPGYLDDETIPENSSTPTYAMATVYVENERWAGVPFILRCGKALNEQKAEIRIQFTNVPGGLFPTAARNELVIRVQPNEAVYVKMMVKRPGLDAEPIISDLDLSYAKRYVDLRIPDAYESLLLDALRGDRSNFVRADELEHAWKIFSPVLHHLDAKHTRPIEYAHGSRGPAEADARLLALGYLRHKHDYVWPKQQL